MQSWEETSSIYGYRSAQASGVLLKKGFHSTGDFTNFTFFLQVHSAGLGLTEEGKVLTAGRAKKDTPMRENVAAISRPSHVLGVLSPYPIVARVIWGQKDQDLM